MIVRMAILNKGNAVGLMKTGVLGLLAALSLTTGNANAWTAIAHSKDSGYTHVVYGAGTPESAEKEALTACSENAMKCELVGEALQGPGAEVIAQGTGAMGDAFGKDVEGTAKVAMQNCQKLANDCHFTDAVWEDGGEWVAIAQDNKKFLQVISGEGIKEKAETRAMSDCRAHTEAPDTCKLVTPALTMSGWLVIVKSKSGVVGVGLKSTLPEATKTAMEACTESSEKDDPCTVSEKGFNNGPEPAPAALKALRLRIKNGEKPQAKKLPPEARLKGMAKTAYSDSCNNASCVRTFSDGHSQRYTACVNPATLLPMNDPLKMGGCGGTDSSGNMFGMKS